MRLMLNTYRSPLGDILLVSDNDGALRALDFADYEQRLRRLLRLHYATYRARPSAGSGRGCECAHRLFRR